MRSIALCRSLLPLMLLAAIACGDGATAPTDAEADFEPIELSLDRIDRGERAPAVNDGPTLQRLLHEAVDRVRAEQGHETARQMILPLRALLLQARDARGAGDFTTARRLYREANLAAARIVLRVLGAGIAARLDERAADAVARYEEMLAAGEVQGNATQLRHLLDRVEDRRAVVARLIDAGARPLALVRAAEILDLLHAARHFL